MEELKPCPFCGQAVELHNKDKGEWYEKFWVQCWYCDARGGVRDEPKEAIEAWNRRADDGHKRTD